MRYAADLVVTDSPNEKRQPQIVVRPEGAGGARSEAKKHLMPTRSPWHNSAKPSKVTFLMKLSRLLRLALLLAALAVAANAGTSLLSLNPPYIQAGGPDVTLSIAGSGFVPGGTVNLGYLSLATTYIDSTKISAIVPASFSALSGYQEIFVRNPDGSASSTLYFDIQPVLTSVTPNSAPAGSPTTPVTVTGIGFVLGVELEFVTASASTPIYTLYVSSTKITAFINASLLTVPGAATIRVGDAAYPVNTTLSFAITSAPAGKANLTSLYPASVAAGGPDTGAQVIAGSIVTWNGTSLPTTLISSTQLTAQVAASWIAAPGSASISVFSPTGVNNAAPATFTILTAASPNLTSLSPASVVAGSPAFSLTVNGSGFVSGAIVQWSGSPLATTFVSATQLAAQVPASNCAAAGSANITVLNPGSAASNALTFTVSPASFAQPVVQSVLNAASYTRTLAPGTWATIFGTRLANSTASAPTVPLPVTLGEVKSVTVGGVAAPLSYVSPGQINFVIPFETALGASVPVVVTASNGGSAPVNITLVRNAPALFTQNAQGTGMAVAFDANFQPVTSVGSGVIILYAVGLGPTNPPASSAQGGASAEPLNRVADQVQVFIGEVPCPVQFAGLAPGFPGIYQLNVIPPAAPASNRLYIVENGVTGNVTTLPVQGGANVTNVLGSIDGLYPASGIYAVRNGNQPTSGPVSFSEMLNAGAATVSFDIRPNAQPFTIMASGPGATAFLQIDPAAGTWQGYVTSPTVVARVGDFSLSGILVYDLLSGTPFPADIIPANRFDPIEVQAAGLLPLPNVLYPTKPSPNGTVVYGSQPLKQSGHFSIGSGQASDDLGNLYFGGFVDIGQPPPSTQTAEFLLFVDAMLVATKDVSYPVQ